MTDELEDFWADIRPPPLPKKPLTVLEWACQGFERGFLWVSLIQPGERFTGYTPPRIRVAIPNDNPMIFEVPYTAPIPISVVGLQLYDREVGGTLLYENIDDGEIRLNAGDTLNFHLSLTDLPHRMSELAGIRTNLRLRGLL